MSNQVNSMNKGLTVKDLVTTGIFTALLFVFVLVGGVFFATNPVLTFFMPAGGGLLAGPIYLLLIAKVHKRWSLSIMGVIMGIIWFVTGMHWAFALGYMIMAIVADFVAGAGQYKSKKLNSLSYILFSLGGTGSYIVFFVDPNGWAQTMLGNVDFEYVPGEPVLKHATFTVPDQKLTAIVGDSGSGKSTILNLIAKYYEATGGTISIGGKPINHVAAERVLEQVSMVDQDVFLFDDTIRDNIRHARPNATDTEIEDACREANCDSFIRKMEKGYDTPTGENGNLLSGGERQRISIARAILKNSPILLLDEATASLDIENELAVKQAIANLLKEKKTVVMIAHTLSIVKNADQILVMGDGRIAESGTHEELLAKGGKYAAMWNAEQKISA